MANNYCGFSAILPVPKDKYDGLAKHIHEIEEAIIKEEGYVGCKTDIIDEGVWFTDRDWDGVPEHVARIAEHIINALQLPEPFYFNYGCWCDKHRLDAFGGGAFVVQLGKGTTWCYPEQYLRNLRLATADGGYFYFTLICGSSDVLNDAYFTFGSVDLEGGIAATWYNHVPDMEKFSKKYPDEDIVLRLEAKDTDRVVYMHFKDGTLYKVLNIDHTKFNGTAKKCSLLIVSPFRSSYKCPMCGKEVLTVNKQVEAKLCECPVVYSDGVAYLPREYALYADWTNGIPNHDGYMQFIA